MALVIDIIVSGLISGSVYALLAIGFSLIFGVARIATIALAMIFQEVMSLIFTGSYLSVPSLVKGYFTILGVKVFFQQLLTFFAALLVMAVLWVLLMRTKLGLAIRSTAQDREVANLMGINEARVAMMPMGISVG